MKLKLKYFDPLSDGVSQCRWSSWSLWTECYLLSSGGKQQRVKLYMGDNCKQNETREYRKCQGKCQLVNSVILYSKANSI